MTRIYESRNHILLCTGDSDPAEHRHMAAHIIIAPDRNMTVFSSGEEFSCRGILIPPGAVHSISTHGQSVLVFLYDSSTNAAARIKEVQPLPDAACDRICRLFSEFEQDGSSDAYHSFENSILSLLGLEPGCGVTDSRILAAMEKIRSGLSEPMTCREAAAAVCLSESRFSHLFRQQAGMTFAAYLICQRLLYCYTRILAGATITEAALEAGFSSSTHFAEVNRRVFGLSASRITKNLTFTKVQ